MQHVKDTSNQLAISSGIYLKSILTEKVSLSIQEIGSSTKQNLEKKLASKIEGSCNKYGYIKPNSVKINSYSSAFINSGSNEFQIVFECLVCHPVEGMKINCIVKTITKAGIHAEIIDNDGIIPATIFVARDHHNLNDHFNDTKEGQNILVKVIGVRFELNDPFVYVIAELFNAKSMHTNNVNNKIKPKKRKVGGNNNSDDEDLENDTDL